jgi:hypothetical protein
MAAVAPVNGEMSDGDLGDAETFFEPDPFDSRQIVARRPRRLTDSLLRNFIS